MDLNVRFQCIDVNISVSRTPALSDYVTRNQNRLEVSELTEDAVEKPGVTNIASSVF